MSLLFLTLFASLGMRVVYLRWSTYKWPPFLVALTLVGLLISGSVEITHRWQEHRYEQIATKLAGRDSDVTCQRFSAALINSTGPVGFVPFDSEGATNQIKLKWDMCNRMLRYRFGFADDSLKMVHAVHILTHEAMHVAGHLNEAEAECAAVQRDMLTAEALGANTLEAKELAQRYWKQIYPHLPTAYMSPECAPGGTFDEQLPTSPWQSSTRP